MIADMTCDRLGYRLHDMPASFFEPPPPFERSASGYFARSLLPSSHATPTTPLPSNVVVVSFAISIFFLSNGSRAAEVFFLLALGVHDVPCEVYIAIVDSAVVAGYGGLLARAPAASRVYRLADGASDSRSLMLRSTERFSEIPARIRCRVI